jgi:hypothetical protein
MAARTEHLVSEGLARREGARLTFARDLLETLRQRELTVAAAQVTAATGKTWRPRHDGAPVSGVFARRLDLASGRFAMIDDGLGFQLVPWKPSMERERQRSQRARHDARALPDMQRPRARKLSI